MCSAFLFVSLVGVQWLIFFTAVVSPGKLLEQRIPLPSPKVSPLGVWETFLFIINASPCYLRDLPPPCLIEMAAATLLILDRHGDDHAPFDRFDRAIQESAHDLRTRYLCLVVDDHGRVCAELGCLLAQGCLDERGVHAGTGRFCAHFTQAHMGASWLGAQD